MGQFSGVILCFLSALLSRNCEGGPCFCAAAIVGIVCLLSWAAIRSPGVFNLTGKWQKRLELTLMNAELYRDHRNSSVSPPLYPKKRQELSPDWIVAVNLLSTAVGLALFCWALHAKFF